MLCHHTAEAINDTVSLVDRYSVLGWLVQCPRMNGCNILVGDAVSFVMLQCFTKTDRLFSHPLADLCKLKFPLKRPVSSILVQPSFFTQFSLSVAFSSVHVHIWYSLWSPFFFFFSLSVCCTPCSPIGTAQHWRNSFLGPTS